MAAAAVGGRIGLNFSWTGGSSFNEMKVKVVNLVFGDYITQTTRVSVAIPDRLSSSRVQLPFTVRQGLEKNQTDLLNVTAERIRNLTINVICFSNTQRSHIGVGVEVPSSLEPGKTYDLEVVSDCGSISARLVKKQMDDAGLDEAGKDEFRRRARNMGVALIEEGLQNLSKRNIDVSTPAGAYDHAVRGVVRAGKQMLPEVAEPRTKPSETPADLDKLPASVLKERFEAAFIKDREFESQRNKAAAAGNVPEMNRIIAVEHENSQLLIMLGEALERKGIKPEVPQSAAFQSAATQAARDQVQALKNLQEFCKTQ